MHTLGHERIDGHILITSGLVRCLYAKGVFLTKCEENDLYVVNQQMHAEWLTLHPQLPSGIPEGLELGSWITKPATEALSVPPSRYMHLNVPCACLLLGCIYADEVA